MMNRILLIAAAALPISASAQLFSDNFDIDHTANWTVNGGPSDESANFFFDYASYGIPSAPGSGGTTRGLRMEANVTSGIFGGFSVSPTGESFAGDYIVSAQVWMNFVGPAPVGGSGSTQLGGLGVGTAGATPQWPGGTQDSVWFATTTDGNSAADWRAYSSAAPTSYPDGDPVYFATTRNASNAYYSSFFPGGTVPAAQTALFPATQTGTSQTGTIAFGWHDSVVLVESGFATWSVDGLPIARVDLSTVTLGGSNIHFMYSDTNTTSTTNPDGLNFMVVDNVVVAVVPEPATVIALGLGAAALLRRRRKA